MVFAANIFIKRKTRKLKFVEFTFTITDVFGEQKNARAFADVDTRLKNASRRARCLALYLFAARRKQHGFDARAPKHQKGKTHRSITARKLAHARQGHHCLQLQNTLLCTCKTLSPLGIQGKALGSAPPTSKYWFRTVVTAVPHLHIYCKILPSFRSRSCMTASSNMRTMAVHILRG